MDFSAHCALLNSYLHKWLELPRSLSSAILYATSNVLQLSFKGLVEEFVLSQTKEAILYRDSKDPRVPAASIEVHSGRKWSAEKELEKTEEWLRQKALVGMVVIGCTGLGYFPSTQIHKARGK